MQSKDLGHLMKMGMRQLATGVCVLSARTENDENFAMTVSSVTSVSDSPASLLVCINQQVSQAQWLSVVGRSFAVHILADHHQNVSNLCAGRDPSSDRFSVGAWKLDGALPILTDALATFLCEIDQVVNYGTHNVVIAKIVDVSVLDTPTSPLLYAQGRYGQFV